MEETINNWIDKARELLEEWGVDPWILAGGAGLILLVIIILIVANRKPKATFPGLVINLFQIAPLGRDAFLKIQNPAGPVILSQYRIIGRNDVLVKNHLSGHRMENQKEYSILLEANGDKRLEPDFSLELTYITEEGKVYQQKLLPGQQRVEPPKRV
ncbi:hypothetical protein [Flavilitoribacter nigricans]|uniref:Uncharacterized protein n=1 Tax=Flavilitoribacter nigricans (strain ATCC 23147 / DSM 23189 / NBRC 102662 / NCIMB 1420 / SS-2) TaxID=1122177 RepID=A0A2D0MY34_FLAN2|nr:hypothetical protein [Flavilitoribacter nigricans]PHN01174.1 hypothetical protein CRP01_38515 [Flavilitoribacter nigricans DSM 23189 = NBRC 102662]